MTGPRRVSDAVLQVLDRAVVTDDLLVLTDTLSRPAYAEVAGVIAAIGGKWDRRRGGHVFDGSAAERLEPVLETGTYARVKQDLGQFDSQPAVVARVMELAGVAPGMQALEPSAGIGNIAVALTQAGADVMAYEIDESRVQRLVQRLRAAARSNMVMQLDFLQARPTAVYDVVAMNPPFSGQADIVHVLHAARFLKPGGRLVSVMSPGTLFRQNRRAAEFRAFVEGLGGVFEHLPEGAFAAFGTNIGACVVSFNTPGAP